MANEAQETNGTLPRKDREEKLRKKRQKIKQHGKALGKIYRDAVEKRGRS
jgi:hypothetical protein